MTIEEAIEQFVFYVVGVPALVLLLATMTAGSGWTFWRLRRKGYTPFVSGLLVTVFVAIGLGWPLMMNWKNVPAAGALAVACMVALIGGMQFSAVRFLPHRRLRVSGNRQPRFPWLLAAKVCRFAFKAGIVALLIGGYVLTTGVDSELFMPLLRVVASLGPFLIAVRLLARHLENMPQRLKAAAAAWETPEQAGRVVYLRAFQNESAPFVIGEKDKYGKLSNKLAIQQARFFDNVGIPFETFFAAEIEKQLGPFMALGNPEDYLPPEGARRMYAPDEDWKSRFTELASNAAVVFIEMSRSGNLAWELDQVLKNGWAAKLYVLTRPEPDKGTATAWSINDWFLRLRGLKRATWAEFAADLNEAGYHGAHRSRVGLRGLV